MKNLLLSLLLIAVLISASCIGENQKIAIVNTPPTPEVSAQQSCVKIIEEKIDSTSFVTSTASIKNDCSDSVEGKIIYTAYEAEGLIYRGFVPSVITYFSLKQSESKTVTTQLPENWFSETEKIARQQYNHGIVAFYDIKIDIVQIGPTPTRAPVVSKYSGEKIQDGPTVKIDLFEQKNDW